MQKNKLALRLTESAIMIAAATILSMFKLVELPYGGSITLASMLPIVIIAYRYGTAWGILCGLVHGAIQLLLGSGTLSYVTGAASVVAVILLDYIVAFAVCGLAGIFRNIKKQSTGAQERARVSLYFFATLLGSISPAKNTTMVVMIVLIDTALTPHFLVTARVTIEAAAICTILVQISRVLMARSKLSST